MTEGYHEMLEEVGACYGPCQGFSTVVSGKKSTCQRLQLHFAEVIF
jgi:hypothetical protein